jgi:SAM-dependent methyltransferase
MGDTLRSCERPSDASMHLFDDWPERYRRWFATPIGALVKRFELELLLELLQPRPGERLLDAGCGSGIFTAPLIERGAAVVGVDLSLPMLRHAVRDLPAQRFAPVAADLRALPFADDRFDHCVSVTALEFVAEGRRAVAELFRVTRPGGRIVVATLNRLGPWAARRTAAARADAGSVFRQAHFRSPDELAALAPVAGEVRSAIHFPRESDPERAEALERAGAARGLASGAFVVASWRKP